MPGVNVRLPDDLHAELRDAAAANSRSLHGEILHRLRTPDALRDATGQGGRADGQTHVRDVRSDALPSARTFRPDPKPSARTNRGA